MAYWLVILGKLQLAALNLLMVSSFLHEQVRPANGEPQVPCFFIFGDSLSDNGNNNNLKTSAKCTYQPYGIDFPKGATGRFTNGRNLQDFIAEKLGFPEDSIPPYASHATVGSVEKILKGVNYASGAAGILKESGRTRGDRISMDKQLINHHKMVLRIVNKLGKKKAIHELLNKCIYSVAIGSNDYINNYFLPQFYPTSRDYTPSQFAQVLIRQLSRQLRTLHGHGARKVVVYGLGLLGCIPYEVRMYGASISGCVDKINEAVMLFNNGLQSLVSDLNNNLTNSTFIFIDSVGISLTSFTGSITVLNKACCQVSKASAPQCILSGKTCSNRTEYAFWDEAHPTETAYSATAARAYSALLPTDSYPFDIQRLAQL